MLPTTVVPYSEFPKDSYEAAKQQPPQVGLPIFWQHIESHFQNLGQVFLHIASFKESFAFNGHLTVESKTSFTIAKDVAVAALKGLTVRAESIKNRGRLLSNGKVELIAKQLVDNSKGMILATTALDVHGRQVRNKRGSIEVLSGSICWTSGHQAYLSNDKGTIFAKEGFLRKNKHATAPRAGSLPSRTINRYGSIIIADGPLEVFLQHIDNHCGLLQGKVAKIDVASFDNRGGRLQLKGDSDILVSESFDNDLGALEIDGHLHLGGNVWKNGAGSMQAALSLEAHVDEFSNCEGGVIAALAGGLKIISNSSLKQQGRMGGAAGIYLASLSSYYAGEKGVLVAPNQLVIVSSQKQYVRLNEGAIHAKECHIESFEQLEMSFTALHVTQDVMARSHTQWIDAKHTVFAGVGGRVNFSADKSMYLHYNSGQIGSLALCCEILSMENGSFSLLDGMDIDVYRFYGSNNYLDIQGNVLVKASRSIESQGSEIKVVNGCYEQVAEEWIIERGDKSSANIRRRDGKSLFITGGHDTAKAVCNRGWERVVMLDCESEVSERLSFASIGTTLLQRQHFDAGSIDVTSDALWMSQIKSFFESSMKLLAQSQAVLSEINSKGSTLETRVSKGDLSLHSSHLDHKQSRFKVKGGVSATHNVLLGDTSLSSTKSQTLAYNTFARGDVHSHSASGAIDFLDNEVHQGEKLALKAKKGAVLLADSKADVTSLKVKGKRAHLRRAKVRAKEKVKARAEQDASFTDVTVGATASIKMEGKEQLNFERVQLQSDQGTHLFTDGFALVNKSHVLGNAALVAKSAAVATTHFTDAPMIDVAVAETLVAKDMLLEGEKISLQHRAAVLTKSDILGKSFVDVQGSTYAADNKWQSDGNIEVDGDDLLFERSQMQVTAGAIDLAIGTSIQEGSRLQADAINECGDVLIAKGCETVATGRHERKAHIVTLIQGKDTAHTLQEKSHSSHHIEHKFFGDVSLKLASDNLLAFSSQYAAEGLCWLVGSDILGTQNTIVAGTFKAAASKAILTHSHLEGASDIQTISDLNLSGSIALGAMTCRAHYGDLNIAASHFVGNSNLFAGGNLFAPQALLQGGNANLQSDGYLFGHQLRVQNNASSYLRAKSFAMLDESYLETSDLHISASSLSRNDSTVRVNNVREEAEAYLSAISSVNAVTNNFTQLCSGPIALSHSHSQVGGIALRRATGDIDHRYATTHAYVQHMTTPSLDTRGGHLAFAGGASSFDVGAFHSDHSTSLKGNGDVKIFSLRPFAAYGTIDMGGRYEVTAPSIAFNTPLKAKGVSGIATQGALEINFPVNTDQGFFFATAEIFNRSDLNFGQRGDFNCLQLQNFGHMSSEQDLSIDQVYYHDIKNARAKGLLSLASTYTIHQQEAIDAPGSLALVSRQGSVISSAPINVNEDFLAQGQALQFNKPLAVKQRGHLYTSGQAHFNHTQAGFGNGITADVGTFFSDVSAIDIVGSSHIVHHHGFKLGCEVSGPTFSRFLGCKVPRTLLSYSHSPSQFRHTGPLLVSSPSGANVDIDGSTFFCNGPLGVEGGDFLIRNRTHLHHERKKVGSVAKRCCGVKYGSTAVYETTSKIIYDGIGHVEVTGPLSLNLQGTLGLDGILSAKHIVGRVGDLAVGVFGNVGSLPEDLPTGHRTSFDGAMRYRAGGDMRAQEGIALDIERSGRNQGFIDGGAFTYLTAQTFVNEKGHFEGSKDVIARRGMLGRHSKRNATIDTLRAGGEIGGRHVMLNADQGFNFGGIIAGEQATEIYGINFSNEAKQLRSVRQFSCGGYAHRAYVEPSQVLSGGSLTSMHRGTLKNIASHMLGWEDTRIQAGSIFSRTIFCPYVSNISKGLTHTKVISDIDMYEPSMRSVQGKLSVIATDTDIDCEGSIGSYSGDLEMIARRDILLRARTESVDNKSGKLSLTPTSLTWSQAEYNTTKSSLPHVFSGGDAFMQAGQAIDAEGLQMAVKGCFDKHVPQTEFRGHKVSKYRTVEGHTLGISCFGSAALESAFAGKPVAHTAVSLLKEDRAIASVFKLASSRDSVDYAVNGLSAAVNTWNEAKALTAAHRQGKLGAGIGQQLGLTDGDGNFSPAVTLRFGNFDSYTEWTETSPTYITAGSLNWHGSQQRYVDTLMDVAGDGVINAQKLLFDVTEERFSHEGEQSGLSLKFGPGGFAVGADFALQAASGYSFGRCGGSFGGHLNVSTDILHLRGAALETHSCEVTANQAHIESVAQHFTSSQFAMAGATDGNFSYSEGRSAVKQVSFVAGISAQTQGLFTADSLHLTGATLSNMFVKVDNLTHSDIDTYNYERSFTCSLDGKSLTNALQGSSSGAALFGGFDYYSTKQKGSVRASILGANGRSYGGINTDIDSVQQQGEKKVFHAAAAFLALDPQGLANEWQQMLRAPLEANVPMQSPKVQSASSETQLSSRPSIKKASPHKKSPQSNPKGDASQAKEEKAKGLTAEAKPLMAASPLMNGQRSDLQPIEEPSLPLPERSSLWIDKERMDVIPIEMHPYDVEQRNQLLETMEDFHAAALVGRAIAYPITKAIELHCESSSYAQHNCQGVAMLLTQATDYLKDKAPEGITQWWQNRQVAIKARAVDNERRLGIPQAQTLQFYSDGEEVIGTLAGAALFAGAGKAVRSLRKANPHTHAPEIISPGSFDRRGLNARDVTPKAPSANQALTKVPALNSPLTTRSIVYLPAAGAAESTMLIPYLSAGGMQHRMTPPYVSTALLNANAISQVSRNAYPQLFLPSSSAANVPSFSNALNMRGIHPFIPRSFLNTVSIAPDTQSVQKIVKLATTIPKGTRGGSNQLNVASDMLWSTIPTHSNVQPIQSFVNSALGGMPHRICGSESHSLRGFSSNALYLIKDEERKAVAVVKEFLATESPQRGFIPDVVSLDYLRKANLKHSSLPSVLAVGKYMTPKDHKRGLVLYNFISGGSVESLLKRKTHPIPARQLGRALGEVNAIGHPIGQASVPTDCVPAVSESYLTSKIDFFKKLAHSTLRQSSRWGMSPPFSIKEVERVCSDLLKNPGSPGLVHGDMHVGNMMVQKSKVTLIDTASLMESIDISGIPHGLPALDKQLMLVSMRAHATKNGYSQAAIDSLLSEFLAGYSELYPTAQTVESNRFAELFWEMFILRRQMDAQNPQLLENSLARINKLFLNP